MEEILVPLGFFVMVGAIWIAAIVMGSRGKRDVQETMRALIASGQQPTPELLSALQKPVRPADEDLRSGVILAALAVGLGLCGALMAGLGGGAGVSGFDGGSSAGFFFAALIVGAIGVGQLIAWWLRRDRAA